MSNLVIVEALGVDATHVYILCPFCGHIHWHGSGKGKDTPFHGSRVPHCTEEVEDEYQEYAIVVTPTTISKLSGHITEKEKAAWKKREKITTTWAKKARQYREWRRVRDIVMPKLETALHERGVVQLSDLVDPFSEDYVPIKEWLKHIGLRHLPRMGYRIVDENLAGPDICRLYREGKRTENKDKEAP